MLDEDLIAEKIGNIQRCLKRIEEKTNFKPETLDNFDIQDIFVLNLQRAIQATIDIAVHYISSEGWGVPRTIKDNFRILFQKGIIGKELTDRLEKMTGFRNIAVHGYRAIDVNILKHILKNHSKDLEDFYTVIFSILQKQRETMNACTERSRSDE